MAFVYLNCYTKGKNNIYKTFYSCAMRYVYSQGDFYVRMLCTAAKSIIECIFKPKESLSLMRTYAIVTWRILAQNHAFCSRSTYRVIRCLIIPAFVWLLGLLFCSMTRGAREQYVILIGWKPISYNLHIL
jgi:hypothetical protein